MVKRKSTSHYVLMRRILVVSLFFSLLAGCAGTAEDAFVGRYRGTNRCRGTNVDTGETTVADPQSITVSIEQASDGSVFIAGSCTIDLTVIGTTRAELVPRICNTTLDDGTLVTADIESGVVGLREPEMTMVINSVNTTPDVQIAATCEFEGVRVE